MSRTTSPDHAGCSVLPVESMGRWSVGHALLWIGVFTLVARRLRAPALPALICLLVLASASLRVTSTAANSTGPDRRGLVAATYDGGEVTVGELEDAIANMSPLARADLVDSEARRALLARVLQFELLAKEAERRGYGAKPAVRDAVKQNSVHRLLANEVDAKLPPELRAFDQTLPSPERDARIEALISPLRQSQSTLVRPELLSLIRMEL